MKWKNKGHEYDSEWMHVKNMHIYIWGAGKNGTMLRKILPSNGVTAFIESDKNKLGEYLNLPVLDAQNAFCEIDCKLSCILISVWGDEGEKIKRQCEKNGWIAEKNVFIADADFLKWQLPKFYTYAFDKTFFWGVTMNITELCTLKCKECTMSIPYIKNPQNEPIESLKNDADVLFHHVDMIANLQLIGGEPFLNPALGELIEYLENKFRKQFGDIVIYTNGTVMPPNKLLKILKEKNIKICISDYTKVSEIVEEKQKRLKKILDEYDIAYEIIYMESWFDYGFRTNLSSNKSEREMITFFDTCNPGCWTIHEGKLYYCYAAAMARKTTDGRDDVTNYIALALNSEKMQSKELVEWYEGYSELGYIETCRFCNGESKNSNCIEVAEQLV